VISDAHRTSSSHDSGEERLRLLVVGASTTPVCGVRDYAQVTGGALEETGADLEFVWWERDPGWSVSRTLSGRAAWLEQVAAACARRPDWVVWHYSVFAWGVHGVPTLVPGAARGLGRLGVPILLVAHELVFPFGRGGVKGRVWATTQRSALIRPLRVSNAVVVTTGERLRWLQTRRWLPRRPARFLPVCSNVPSVHNSSEGHISAQSSGALVVGVFGFGAVGALARETMGAVARLRADGREVHAVLIGAPGEKGAEADRWRTSASEAGIPDALTFTGVLPLGELARALAVADVVVLPDPAGPSSRRGTVAAALALAKPTVAVDGPERWEHLAQEGALALARPSSEGLAEALGSLIRSRERRRALGARAEAFYDRHMAPNILAQEMRRLVESDLPRARARIATPNPSPVQ
jgi:hypothetical protein